jgi:hypothetical protein
MREASPWRNERRLAIEIAEAFVERQQNEALSPSDFKDLPISNTAVLLPRSDDVPAQVAQVSDGSARKILIR